MNGVSLVDKKDYEVSSEVISIIFFSFNFFFNRIFYY